MLNTFFIILFFVCLIGLGFYFSKELSKQPAKEIEEQVGENITLEKQILRVTENFDSIIKQDLSLYDLTEKEYKEAEKKRDEILENLDKASKGYPKARNTIKGYIKNMLVQGHTGINHKNIGRLIAFDDPTKLTNRDKFEICHHYYLKKAVQSYKKLTPKEQLVTPPPTRTAMKNLIEENEFDLPIYDENKRPQHIVDDAKFDAMYKNVTSKPDFKLEYADKIDIVTQRIYAQFKGFSVADIFLANSGVDEVDGGVSGIPETGFQFKMLPNMDYSWKHLWIVWNGTSILLKGCQFDSHEDLQRVVDNIYQNNPPYALTQESGFIATSMADDTRIVCCIPPVGEDCAFFARKHDTAKGLLPEQIICQKGGEDVITLIKWLVRGRRNIIVSGEQASGKTTFLKMLFNFVEDLNIRVNEMMFELGLRYAFPNKNIFSMQATSSVSMEMAIDISKKMNGGINIIGEIAEAILTALFCLTTQRGGSFNMASYHGMDTPKTINTMGQDLVQMGVAKSLTEGKALIAEVLNINIHLDNDRPQIDITNLDEIKKELVSETRRVRHIGFIDEVIPVVGESYPHPKPQTQEEAWENEAEYYKRQTDRQVYEINRLVDWENGRLVIRNIPSEEMCSRIIQIGNLSRADEIEFRKDMEYLKTKIVKKTEKTEVA